jgi:hypothetical protein
MEWAVLDWNEPAIKSYRALGARPMDAWQDGYPAFTVSWSQLESQERNNVAV